MTFADFANVFAILAVQLRATDSDETTVKAYFHALKGLSLEAIQQAAVDLSLETDRKFFPTTAEWATAAGNANTRVFRQHLLANREEPWRLECDRCEDTGWKLYTCDGDDFCGRKQKHYAHNFARICACRPTNRTWQRHQTVGRGPSA